MSPHGSSIVLALVLKSRGLIILLSIGISMSMSCVMPFFCCLRCKNFTIKSAYFNFFSCRLSIKTQEL